MWFAGFAPTVERRIRVAEQARYLPGPLECGKAWGRRWYGWSDGQGGEKSVTDERTMRRTVLARWAALYSLNGLVRRTVKTTARIGGNIWKDNRIKATDEIRGFQPMQFCCLQLTNESTTSYIRYLTSSQQIVLIEAHCGPRRASY